MSITDGIILGGLVLIATWVITNPKGWLTALKQHFLDKLPFLNIILFGLPGIFLNIWLEKRSK